jgi:hypothetical protein
MAQSSRGNRISPDKRASLQECICIDAKSRRHLSTQNLLLGRGGAGGYERPFWDCQVTLVF